MGCGKYTTSYWRDPLDQNAQGLDVGKLLAWINEESGGCPAALGATYEVGIGQLDLEDGPAWGGSLDTLHGAFSTAPNRQSLARDLTDDEELLQVTSLVAFAQHARSFAQQQLDAIGASWNEDDLWCLTKLYHGLPRLSDQYLRAASNAGAASSWSDFASWLGNLSQSDAIAINSAVGTKYYATGLLAPGFSRFITNAQNVGYAGSLAGLVTTDTLLVLAALAAIALFLHHFV